MVTFYPCFTTDNCADGTMMTQQIDPADCCAMMGIMAFEGTDGVCAPCGGSTIGECIILFLGGGGGGGG